MLQFLKFTLIAQKYLRQLYLDFSIKLIKIYNMKRFSILFLTLFIMMSVCAAASDNGGHAGTPPGFYDDIDPNSLEYLDENDLIQRKKQENENLPAVPNDNELFQTFYENNNSAIQSVNVPPTKNYTNIYNSLEPADFSYLHNIDPDQYYDMKDSAWSVYPLLRLNSPIYFKNSVIEPGYYLLTPREHKNKWYILFKQNGQVAHIIPVFERSYTPEKFYDEHIPKPKLTPSQKVHMKILSTVGKTKSSKRKEPIQSYLEVNDLDNYLISIVIYYGGHKYSTLFRTIRL